LVCGSVEQHPPAMIVDVMVSLASVHVLAPAGTPLMVPGHGIEQLCCPMHASAAAVRFHVHVGFVAISVRLHVPFMMPKNANATWHTSKSGGHVATTSAPGDAP
jgi:hypothetical protein